MSDDNDRVWAALRVAPTADRYGKVRIPTVWVALAHLILDEDSDRTDRDECAVTLAQAVLDTANENNK